MVKIKIKNKLEGNKKFLNWSVKIKIKIKITLTKEKQIKKTRDKLKKKL
jgi:hypothetical protein